MLHAVGVSPVDLSVLAERGRAGRHHGGVLPLCTVLTGEKITSSMLQPSKSFPCIHFDQGQRQRLTVMHYGSILQEISGCVKASGMSV